MIKNYLLQLQKNENCLKRTVSVGMCHFEKNPPKVFTQTKKIIISVFLLQYFFLFTFNGRRKVLFVYQDEFNDSSFFILSTLHFFFCLVLFSVIKMSFLSDNKTDFFHTIFIFQRYISFYLQKNK